MSDPVHLSPDGATLTVTVPLSVRRRGGRKAVLAPPGAPAWALSQRRVDSALVKALARAFRWRRLLEKGRYVSVQEIAAAEKINASYVSRVLRLSLLAPDIVEGIMDGQTVCEAATLLAGIPSDWSTQRQMLVYTAAWRPKQPF